MEKAEGKNEKIIAYGISDALCIILRNHYRVSAPSFFDQKYICFSYHLFRKSCIDIAAKRHILALIIIDILLMIMYYYYVIKKCTLKSEEEGEELAKLIALRERIDYIIKSLHAHCIAGER